MKNLKINVGSFATAKLQAKIRISLLILILAVIGFSMAACSSDEDGGGANSVTVQNNSDLTITSIKITAYPDRGKGDKYEVLSETVISIAPGEKYTSPELDLANGTYVNLSMKASGTRNGQTVNDMTGYQAVGNLDYEVCLRDNGSSLDCKKVGDRRVPGTY